MVYYFLFFKRKNKISCCIKQIGFSKKQEIYCGNTESSKSKQENPHGKKGNQSDKHKTFCNETTQLFDNAKKALSIKPFAMKQHNPKRKQQKHHRDKQDNKR